MSYGWGCLRRYWRCTLFAAADDQVHAPTLALVQAIYNDARTRGGLGNFKFVIIVGLGSDPILLGDRCGASQVVHGDANPLPLLCAAADDDVMALQWSKDHYLFLLGLG